MSFETLQARKRRERFPVTTTLRAERMQRSLGTKIAAGYMRNQGYSIETALYLLCGAALRD